MKAGTQALLLVDDIALRWRCFTPAGGVIAARSRRPGAVIRLEIR